MRLLRKFLLYDGTGTHAANNGWRITVAGAPTTGTVAASALGTAYYLSDDGAADDLISVLDTAISATVASFDLTIYGVTTASTAGIADGCIRAFQSSGSEVILTAAHASWTLPAGVLGLSASLTLTTGVANRSPSIHRYGWYPHQFPNENAEHRRSWSDFVPIRGSVDEDGLTWGSYAVRRFAWYEGVVASPYLRAEAAADTTWMAAYGLTTGTQWGHWEQFCEDLRDAETAGERDWRYYPDVATEATYFGPYRLRPESLLADPMAAWQLPTPAGGSYAGAFEGHRDL